MQFIEGQLWGEMGSWGGMGCADRTGLSQVSETSAQEHVRE